ASRAGWRATLVASAVLATFSKETGLLLLPIVLLHDVVVERRRPWRQVRVEYALVAAVALVYLFARAGVAQIAPLPDEPSALDNPIVEAGFWAGRLTGLKAVGRELLLLVWPVHLSADYSFAQLPLVELPPRSWEDWQAAVALAAIVALVAMSVG